MSSGTLYIVATPIGNLDDITVRATQVLADVDRIAAEDTRHSKRLLQHLGIDTPLLSLHEHNESQRAQRLLESISKGESVALISDAGTPLISDPGYELVNQCRRHHIDVVPIPGACALVTALSAAGLPTHGFQFLGFLPVKQQARYKQLSALQHCPITSVFYEAPRRIRDTVAMAQECLGDDRQCALAKELTKTFETFVYGSLSELLTWLDDDPVHQKGEFVLMIGPADTKMTDMPEGALELLDSLTAELPLKKAAAITAAHYGLKKNALYQIGLERQ